MAFTVSGAFAGDLSKVKEALKCPANHYLVRAHKRRAYQRADGTNVHSSEVSQTCRRKFADFNFWNTKLKSGRPREWPGLEESTDWTIEQRLRVLEAISELPPQLKVTTLEGVFRFKRSKYYPNPAARVGNSVGLFDSAFDANRNLARIIAHELGHLVYDSLSSADKSDYERSAAWRLVVEGRQMYWVPRKSGFVADDGKRSRDEDFANNLEYLLFEPKVLRSVTPKVYEWMKRKFDATFRIRGVDD